jgi:hypothetical protein
VAALFAALAATLSAMMVMVNRNRESHYDKEAQRAVLSAMRESYESQIATLSREMTATQERWRDANHLLMTAQQRLRQVALPKVEMVRNF